MKRFVISIVSLCSVLYFSVSICCAYVDFYTPYKSGNKEDALKLFKKSIEEKANEKMFSNALMILGDYNGFIGMIDEKKDYDFGIQFCTDCIDKQEGEQLSKKCNFQLKKKNVLTTSCMRSRAVFYLKKKEYEKSISDYENAIRSGSDLAWNYHEYALLLATFPVKRYRNGEKALELAKKSFEIEPNHFALNAIAAAYAEIGDFESAVKKQNETISSLESLPGASILDNVIMGATIYPELNVLPYVEKKKDFDKLLKIYKDRLKKYEAKKAWSLTIK